MITPGDSHAPLPEIREAEASPEVAAIYAEIKTLSGLPQVNLIWRHFAALPGVLPWAWGAVRPLVASRSMAEARLRLAAAVPLPAPGALPDPGLTPAEWDRVQAMLAAYIQGNLTNLVALTALRLRLEQPQAAAGRLLPVAAPPPAPPPLEPLPRLADLPPGMVAAIRALAARHDGGSGVIPSLYLHLAHWPGLLGVLPDWLGPVFAPGALEAVRAATRRLAEAEAAALLPAPTAPPAGTEPAVAAALGRFTGQVIADLLPVCLYLAARRPAGAGQTG